MDKIEDEINQTINAQKSTIQSIIDRNQSLKDLEDRLDALNKRAELLGKTANQTKKGLRKKYLVIYALVFLAVLLVIGCVVRWALFFKN